MDLLLTSILELLHAYTLASRLLNNIKHLIKILIRLTDDERVNIHDHFITCSRNVGFSCIVIYMVFLSRATLETIDQNFWDRSGHDMETTRKKNWTSAKTLPIVVVKQAYL